MAPPIIEGPRHASGHPVTLFSTLPRPCSELYLKDQLRMHTPSSVIMYVRHQSDEGLDEGSDVDFFSLKVSTLKKMPSFLSLHQPQTSHEYYLCILAMSTVSCKDVKHVNWPILV